MRAAPERGIRARVIETAFTRLLGLRVPLQLAALPFHGEPDLAVAFAEAGGLGMLGLPVHPPDTVAAVLESAARRTRGALGVGFLVPFLQRASVEAAASRARVVEFFYGEPDPSLVALVHAGGALASWQVGSRDEAIAAERAGCDLVVAQGVEAGGHVRSRIGLLPLLAQTLEAVRRPVLAAGGIGGPRELAAVLAAGAAGARLGTRMLAAREANVHPAYLERLLAARSEDTVLTEAFSADWPEAPHRVLRSAVLAAESLEGDVAGSLATSAGEMPVPRLGAASPSREATGAIEAMALYAGESVAAASRVEPAAEIVRSLIEGAGALLARETR
jgi:NAD(P)H-dependent flavin oxidoreductase YrpB (nitropropane dioxygenase family)